MVYTNGRTGVDQPKEEQLQLTYVVSLLLITIEVHCTASRVCILGTVWEFKYLSNRGRFALHYYKVMQRDREVDRVLRG